MNDRARAEEHLRVIRSLMERATIYRAISAPTALIGGLLAVATTFVIWWFDRSQAPGAPGLDNRLFAEIWLAILAVVLAINTFFVRQEALRDGRVLLSSGARLALRAIAPCLLIPAATTIWYFRNAEPIDQEILVAVWIAFYGLCLLATALFAPRSLVLLGWAFLLSGLLLIFWPKSFGADPRGLYPNFAMGATFGLYHLVYAVCVWASRQPDAREILAPE
ncbi:MAG: hypothetical protein M3480_06000 [Verrucomicrobiota bacterium]|nr:hypothetical protein [Chthoniobacterales bacterium]MDQ3414514.1 hypothetical protein [Verrucomicrobiota bacterium]